MLEALKYVIRVSAGEYAKYYFHLRSMMARLGFHENEPAKLQPLDIEGARRLQLATEKFQAVRIGDPSKRRMFCIGVNGADKSMAGSSLRRNVTMDELSHHALVGLEQIVHMQHVSCCEILLTISLTIEGQIADGC